MAYKFFTVPMHGSPSAEEELNRFLRSHKVLSVDRRWVDQGPSSFWSFCIDYLEQEAASGANKRPADKRGSRVDYREKLSPEQFEIFAKLRELRKELAQADGVPVYAVFNNEQLAQMVESQSRTKADLEAIAGVGDARLEKYGDRFVEFENSMARG